MRYWCSLLHARIVTSNLKGFLMKKNTPKVLQPRVVDKNRRSLSHPGKTIGLLLRTGFERINVITPYPLQGQE